MKNRDYDLWLIDILTILLILVIVIAPSITPLRIALGLPLILFFPGYTLIAALFPRKESLGGVERIALSFGLSIAVVPLIGLILNYTPWGIRLYPMLISLTVFILAMSGIAWHRRRRLAPQERFAVGIHPHPSTTPDLIRGSPFKGEGVLDRVLSIVLTVAIIGAIGALGYVIATPKAGEKFTEFYILGPEGKAEGHSQNLSLGEKREVTLGIVNHEQERVSYQVKVVINDAESGVKIWLGNENGETTQVADNAIVVNELANNEKWERKIIFQPLQRGGGQKLEFLLFSPKLRENHHIRSGLDGSFADIEINEAEGKGKITLENKSTASQSYKLEVWQERVVQKEIEFTVVGGEEREQEFGFPPGKAIFWLYESDKLVLKDRGDKLSLHLGLNVS